MAVGALSSCSFIVDTITSLTCLRRSLASTVGGTVGGVGNGGVSGTGVGGCAGAGGGMEGDG